MTEYYYRLCNDLKDIGSFYPLKKNPYDVIKTLDKDYYKSVFVYTKDQVNEAETEIEVEKNGKKYKRKKGLGYINVDNAVGNKLVFDFDSTDHELARKDAIELINRLKQDTNLDDIQIYFSGGKGFHVEVELDSFLLNKEIKAICMFYLQGLQTADVKVYNPTRIFRLPLTKHKSGNYKVPLTYDDLLSLSQKEIHEYAKTKLTPDTINGVWGKVKVTKTMKEKAEEIIQKPEIVAEKIQSPDFETIQKEIDNLDFSHKPIYLTSAKYVLHQGLIPQGYGQESRMILCSSYKAAGYPAEYSYKLLRAVSEQRVKRFGPEYEFEKDELWNNVIMSVYSSTWQGGTFGMDNALLQKIDTLLPPYLRYGRYNDNVITSTDEAFTLFTKYAKDIDKNTVKFGIPTLDKKLRMQVQHLIGLLAPPSVGKCHTRGTEVLMYDGSIKKVEDIEVGDRLMGDDSTPRTVLSLARGREKLYNVHTDSGYYGVNESHILSLRNTQSNRIIHGVKPGDTINISVKDYIEKVAESSKRRLRGYRVGVEFEHIEPEYSPYLVGSWIGDGSKNSTVITNQDDELTPVYEELAKKNNLGFNIHTPKNRCRNYSFTGTPGYPNHFYTYLKNNCLDENGKRLPKDLLINSKKVRSELLAGLIDTDGYYHEEKRSYEITFKEKDLINDLQYLCRSLGLRCQTSKKIGRIKEINFEGTYYRAYISGDLSEIPIQLKRKKQKKGIQLSDKNAYTIRLEELGEGDYYGFELDGNHLYCLADFSVTHNTSWAITVLNNTSKEGTNSMFFSFDMSRDIVMQKLIQRHTGLTNDEIFEVFKSGNKDQIKKFKTIIDKNYENVSFCFKTGLDPEQMEKAILEEEERLGKEIKLIVVDYLGLIRTNSGDPTQSSQEAIQALRSIAQNLNKAVIVLLQPNKMNSKVDEPLLNYTSAKGSSAIAEACTAILTAHRPGMSSLTPENDKFFGINCVKNRAGALFSADFHWEGRRGIIRDLEDIEYQALKELRDNKKAEKESEEKSRW